MSSISSVFLVLSLVLAVVIGPQTRPWSWGPAMLALGVATLAALPCIWRRGRSQGDFGIISFALLTAGWFGWRAWISPVAEYGQADLLLLCAATCAFIAVRGIMGDLRAERILTWGIALLMLANLIVIGMQIKDPSYSPVFRSRASPLMISGFFAHYNEAANYLIASSMLLGGFALMGRHMLVSRIFFGLLVVGGLAGVWFTTSRGGILGAAVGSGVLMTLLLIIGGRKKAKWFAPALVTIPILAGIAISAFLLMGWESAQESRKAQNTSVDVLLDNNCRLYFLGMAMSCIEQHPLAGGGSRSFSWECFSHAEGKDNGDTITHRPDMVHNEMVQAASDYGLIGAALLAGLLGAVLITCSIRVMFEKLPPSPDSRDAWRLGGTAALAGMMVQSSFSFVFHLLPGILLLGICLGQMSRTGNQGSGVRLLGTRILLTLPLLACLLLVFPMGLKGARVTRTLWESYFSKTVVPSEETQIDTLTDALAIWPQAEFYQHRAELLQKSAKTETGAESNMLMERALNDYRKVAMLQPFDPTPVINMATLLSRLNRDHEAEVYFEKAIALQGGMEPAYRARFLCATHYLFKGLREFSTEHPEPALKSLERAALEIENAVTAMHWMLGDMHDPRVAIHESLGVAREAAGDQEGALQSYNFAATLRNGSRAHYRAGVLLGRRAVATWGKRRPAEAMYDFIEAKKRVMQAGSQLPQGVTPSDRLEYISYLDRSIKFLKDAKVEPKQ